MLNNIKKRAGLGIDGNYGYALLGANIQDGEVEFVEIPVSTTRTADSTFATPKGDVAAELWACKEALRRLRIRLNDQSIGFYFLDSHPYGV